jgi:tight adherence protein B
MFDAAMQSQTLAPIAAGALVIGLWSLALGLWHLVRQHRRGHLIQRLTLDTPDPTPSGQTQGPQRTLRLWRQGQVAELRLAGRTRLTPWRALDRLREDAGWQQPTGVILAGLLAAAGLGGAMAWALTHTLLAALAAAVVVLLSAWTWLQTCITKQQTRFDQQLLDALELASRSLRAGHPLTGALRLVGQEIEPPVGDRFTEVCEKQDLGQSLGDALLDTARRSRHDDMQVFATAVVIQLTSGGNLADMMDRLSAVIRQRLRLRQRAKVLTAQAQLSKRVLLALPIGMFLLLHLINPAYMQSMYDQATGRVMLALGALGLTLGAWVMNQMAKVRY